MTSGHDVSEYLGPLGLVKSYFFKFFEKKIKKIEEKNYLGAPTDPEDQAIRLFAVLLANPDMSLSLHSSFTSTLLTTLSHRSSRPLRRGPVTSSNSIRDPGRCQ